VENKINEIKIIVEDAKKSVSASDTKVSSADTLDELHREHYEINNSAIKVFVKHYEESHKEGRKLRATFFRVVLAFMGIILLGSVATLIALAARGVTVYGIGVAVTAMVSLITLIIALPTIIAKHLFPVDEDKHLKDLLLKSLDEMHKKINRK